MADLSDAFAAIDNAIGPAPASPQSSGQSAYPTKPGLDSAGAPAPLDTDVIVNTPAKPRVVQGTAPAPDSSGGAGSAIYAGGQASSADAPTTAPSHFDLAISAIDDAIAGRRAGSTAATPSQTTSAPLPTWGQVAEQPGVGFNENLADTLGAPVDAMSWALTHPGKIARAMDFSGVASGLPAEPDLPQPAAAPFGGSQSIKNALGVIGANPDDHPANSAPERVARGIGSGAAAMLLPAGAVGAASEAGAIAPEVASALGEAVGTPATGAQATGITALGATSGGAGNLAAENVPEPFKPYAELAGNLLGGGSAAALGKGVAFVGKGAGAAKDFLSPLTAKGRQNIADQRLAKGASSPIASIDAIDNEQRELVPGSRPTTFQLTGDRGLGQMERQSAKKAPEQFLGRTAEQNAARVGAIRAAAPNGDPQAVSDAFRSHLASLDDMVATVEASVRKNAAEHETAARDTAARHEANAFEAASERESRARETAAETSTRARSSASQAEERARGAASQNIDVARRGAQAKAASLGGEGTPEGYGSALRARLQEAKDAAKARERALWEAVDPGRRLALDASPISAAARRALAEISPMSTGMKPEEAELFKKALAANGTRRFFDVAEMRTDVNEALRDELKNNGETKTYRRLSILRGAIETAINGAVESKAATEAEAVASGALSPEDTMAAKVQAEVDAFHRTRAEAAGANASQNYSTSGGSRSAGVSGFDRAEVQSRRGSPNAARDQGVSGELAPNFDQGARDRLTAATNATRERAATFSSDPIGAVLRAQGTKGTYRLADSSLGDKLFPKGPGGAEVVRKFLAAAGNTPEAQAQMRDFAAASLRRNAMRTADGTLDPARTAAWLKSYRDALRGMPGLADRFIDAARGSSAIDDEMSAGSASVKSAVAQGSQSIKEADAAGNAAIRDALAAGKSGVREASSSGKSAIRDAVDRGTAAIEEAATARRQTIDEYQKGLVGKIIGSDNAIDTTRVIGSIFGRQDSVALMRRVATETRGNPEAEEGLKKAIVDHISDNFLGDKTEDGQTVKVIKGEAFKRFVSKNMGPLAQVFKPQELAGIRAVADDLARSDQSLRTKLPGQSNTAQDQAHESQEHSGLGVLTEAIVGGSEAAHHLGVVGFIGGAGAAVGKMLLNVARQAGLRTVDDVVREMLLHPDLARAGLARATTAQQAKQNAMTFAQQIRRVSVFAPALSDILEPNGKESGK